MLADFSRIALLHGTHDNDQYEPPVLLVDKDPSDAGRNSLVEAEDHEIYDPVWGYFTFGQSVAFEYGNGAETYTSSGEFRIKGAFTVNAEFPPKPSGNLEAMVPDDDIARFDKMKLKYDFLSGLFRSAALAIPPYDHSSYGTDKDARCVKLPDIIVDEKGKNIYARPVGIRIMETQWPNLISYEAVLGEVESLRSKMTVNGVIVDGGVLSISARKPMIKMQAMMFANGADVYHSGWEPRSYNMGGSIPDVAPSGYVGTWRIANMFNHLQSGRVDIGKWTPPLSGQTGDGTFLTMHKGLFLDSSNIPFAVADGGGQDTRIVINAKE